MFAGSFSAFQSGAVSTVTLALDPFAARLTAERSWHPSQHQTLHSDGSATLTLEVTIAPDLENWILGWGHHAEVIQPTALRKKIASTIASMHTIYSKIGSLL